MSKGKIILFYPSYEGMGEYHWFPFPYLYIGPFLEDAGFTPVIIDARVDRNWRQTLKEELSDALCVGVTSMTGSDIKDAIEASGISKRSNPKLKVIWGGPHATAEPFQTLKSEYIDVVVPYHGEHIMAEIADRICRDKGLNGIPAIIYKQGGCICRDGAPERVAFNYEMFPGFHLIDIERYRSPNNVISIFTARGCPYLCTFCTTKDKGYSERTLDQVKKEILYVVNELRFRNIFFQDGTFFVKKERIMKIVRWLVNSDLKIRWKAKARANSLISYSQEELALLKKSGLVSLFFGLESGSQRVLDNMRKQTTLRDAERSARVCRDYDIEFYTSFMFATPNETQDDIRETIGHIKRLKKINPEMIVQNCIYLPLPATPMYDEARKNGFEPPTELEGWIGRSISSRFEDRDDVTWIPGDTLKRYIEIYDGEFGRYRHLYEKERDGEYKSVFKK